MDDEEMPPGGPQAPMMRSLALTATGDFFLLVGMFFVLLGAANFITDLVRIKGSGEAAVGFALIALAIALLLRSQAAMRSMRPQRPAKREMPRSEDYR